MQWMHCLGSPSIGCHFLFCVDFKDQGGGRGERVRERECENADASFLLSLSLSLDSYNPVEIPDYSSFFLLLILVNCAHGLFARKEPACEGCLPSWACMYVCVCMCVCVFVCVRGWIPSMQNQKYVLHTSKKILAYISLLHTKWAMEWSAPCHAPPKKKGRSRLNSFPTIFGVVRA